MEREPGKKIRQTIIATDSSKLAEVKTRSSSGLRKARRFQHPRNRFSVVCK